MSIHAMTTAAMGFREGTRKAGLLRGVSEAERRAGHQPLASYAAVLEAVVAYIPTEIVTAYVAVLAAIANESSSRAGQWLAFVLFLILTPVAVWLIYAGKFKAAQGRLPTALRTWPLWEMIASSIAFLTWAYALPDSPFRDLAWYNPGLGTVALLTSAFLLGLLAPLFQPSNPEA